MQDLRLIGVHEDGQHLLLAGSDGGRFRLPLDDALRAAARRDRPRLGQIQIEIDGGLRPRDVQALLRRGLSTEEVADRAGWTVEKVQRFEGPILAEREYVAGQARGTVVDSYGTEPLTLGDRVGRRLEEREVDTDTVVWDSARVDDGTWRVHLHFVAGGRERTATWRFDPTFGAVAPANDEARWLGEDDRGGSLPAPHVATSANRLEAVFDVDAPAARGNRASERQAAELASSLREGRRSGARSRRRAAPTHTPVAEAPRADALPLEQLPGDLDTAGEPPAARGYHDVAAHLDDRADGAAKPEQDTIADLPNRPATGVSRTLRVVPSEPAPETTETQPTQSQSPAPEPGAAEPEALELEALEPEALEPEDIESEDIESEALEEALAPPASATAGSGTSKPGAPGPAPVAPAPATSETAASETAASETAASETAASETAASETATSASPEPAAAAPALEASLLDDGREGEPAPVGSGGSSHGEERTADRRRTKRGRTSVPSWDDIMFGNRTGGSD